MSKVLPGHLRALLRDGDEGATGRLAALLSRDDTGPLSTSRLRRGLSLSKVAMKAGAHALGYDPKGLELAMEMVRTFGELRGITAKLGQMLSYVDDALPPEAKKVLALLQRDLPPMPFETVESVIRAELGPIRDHFVDFETRPFAAASIGQVHRAKKRDGALVAVKVQYPGIEAAMAADLKNAKVGALMKRVLFYNTDFDGIFAELEQRFLDECDYRKEAQYQEDFARRFANHPVIIIPDVHRAETARRVLTTTLMEGQSFHEWLESDPSTETRSSATRAFYRFYLGSFYLDGLFNCDPHPGNYLFRSDGSIVFLDHGCARRYPRDRINEWVQLCLAVVHDDGPALDRLAVSMGFFAPETQYDRESFRGLLRYLYLPYLEDVEFDFAGHRPVETFRRMFVDNANLRALNMPPDAVFLNRIGFGLVSLMSEIGSKLNIHRMAHAYFEGIDPDWIETRGAR
ncbi:MAG: AarF/ABC1/UbiB kinase family protein [Deltaproteobacteria bacterium]|nr:AarF/ABC1/UbiB kinase family protein [Deltaproteobacteria bacterium]